MPKNLVLIHLESVSQSALWQIMGEVPTLWNLSTQSAFFRRFYTASTSSVMSMCDMVHGDSSELDHNAVFPKNKTSLLGRASNMFTTLLERGYRTKGVQYGSFCLGDAPNNFWGVWPDACGPFGWYDRLDAFHGEIDDFLDGAAREGKPFALYFWNMATHIRNDPENGGEGLGFHERFQQNYRTLDSSIKRLLDGLAGRNLLDDTMIVVFGDHGDDFWRHGFSKGRTHVIEPYSNLCLTPLFITGTNIDIGIFDNLISSIDLKHMILRMLFPDVPPEGSSSVFSGIDLLSTSRELAFSQSLFALQIEYSDVAKAVTKSYAVTDGAMRLMASSGGKNPREGGMEFFLEQWDYGNTSNMLDFFHLDAEGHITGFNQHDAVHPHFYMSFTHPNIVFMAKTYERLRSALMQFIALKESEAKKHSRNGEMQLFPMEMFTVKRPKRW